MKKIFLFSFFVVAILFGRQNVHAQITVDYVYTTDMPTQAVKLSSGLKYYHIHSLLVSAGPPVIWTTTYFVLYNPDHSIYRTINIPQISGKFSGGVLYVSDALFDLDTLIEYMFMYTDMTTYDPSVAILNENGSTLLYVDSAAFSISTQSIAFVNGPIYPDGNQTKLFLHTNYYPPTSTTGNVTVYNLPGRLACIECDSGFVNGIAQPPSLLSEENKLMLYPNPNNGNATIEFKLPKGIREGEIVLYKMDGSEVKRYKVDGTFGNLILNNSGLSAGTYMYQLIAGSKAVDAKRMIVVH